MGGWVGLGGWQGRGPVRTWRLVARCGQGGHRPRAAPAPHASPARLPPPPAPTHPPRPSLITHTQPRPPQFYLVFALASMYIAMLMTGWGSQAGEAKVRAGGGSVAAGACSGARLVVTRARC